MCAGILTTTLTHALCFLASTALFCLTVLPFYLCWFVFRRVFCRSEQASIQDFRTSVSNAGERSHSVVVNVYNSRALSATREVLSRSVEWWTRDSELVRQPEGALATKGGDVGQLPLSSATIQQRNSARTETHEQAKRRSTDVSLSPSHPLSSSLSANETVVAATAEVVCELSATPLVGSENSISFHKETLCMN